MDKILQEFDDKKQTFESFSKILKSLVESLLVSEGISVHSISCRVKDKGSLRKKIIKKQRYEKISDITDIVGVRIITHYSDEVDKVASIIESEFDIDESNSIDKRKTLEPDRFGYLSLHYVASLREDRCKLKEYLLFKGMKAEFQVRSILQHTWAEIEHDIGYKSSKEVPNHIRRQFSQLAGLLEIADTQFIAIKESLQSYKEDSAAKIEYIADDVTIDKITLTEYFKKSKTINEIKETLRSQLKVELTDDFSVGFNYLVEALAYLKIESIGRLNKELEGLKDLTIKRISDFSNALSQGEEHVVSLPPLVLITALSQVIAAKDGDLESVIKFLSRDKTQFPNVNIHAISEYLVSNYSLNKSV
ncbi:GTP pyrophosphokinase family protein [Erwinia sp. AnSW2-5]|uniref:GTP pyrophosphokinase n=1 Tax=Erwinia sp. AnSW2-5 TaxID=3367692 RepID=UPI00385CA3B6